MLKKRIIPTLLLHKNNLVKTINFDNKKYIGDPLNVIKIFNEKFVDELIILDIGQNNIDDEIDYEFLKDLFSECFVPVTYGGGITSVQQADKILKLGVEKICLNSTALNNRGIIKDFAKNFGSQSVVIRTDVQKNMFNKYQIFNNRSNKFEKGLNFIDYISELEEFGAGEIIINSIDNDGVMKGMDINLIKITKDITSLPIVYCGGIGSIEHIKEAFNYQISGVSAGSYFVFYGPHKAVLITYPHDEFENL